MTPLQSIAAFAMQILAIALLIGASSSSDTVTQSAQTTSLSSVQQNLATTGDSIATTRIEQATVTSSTSPTTTLNAYEYYVDGEFKGNITTEMSVLITTWCLPYFNFPNTTDPYEQILKTYLHLCQADIEYISTGVTQWGINNIVAPLYSSEYQFDASSTYITQQLSSNANISRAFLNEHCTNYASYAIFKMLYDSLWGLISVPGLILVEDGDRLASAHLVFFPLSVLFFYVSLSVLSTLKKQEPEFTSIILFRADVVAQFIGYLSFFINRVVSADYLLLSPFCFISPTFAVNINGTVRALCSYLAFPFIYIWVYQAFLRVGIALDRVLALYKPMWYHFYVTEKLMKKYSLILSTLYWCLCVSFVCGTMVEVYRGQQVVTLALSNLAKLDVSAAAFGVCFPVAFLVYAVLTVTLSAKLCKKSVAVAGNITEKQRKLTVMVLFTSAVYLFACGVQVAYILIIICNNHQPQGQGPCVPNYLGPFEDTLQGLLPFILDFSCTLCLFLQCIFSSMFRDALRAWFASSLLGKCCKTVLNRGNLVVPISSAANAHQKSSANVAVAVVE